MNIDVPYADAYVPAALDAMLSGKVSCPPEIRQAVVLHPSGTYRRRAPVFCDAEAVPAELRATLDLYLQKIEQPFGALYLVHLAPAIVGGQGTVVLPSSGVMVKETVLEFLAQGALPDGTSRVGDDGYRFVQPVSRTISAPTILVQRPWYRNYGHFLVDGAALLAMLAEAHLPKGTQIVVGAQESEALRSIVHQTLSIMRPDMQVLERPENETWRFERLVYVTPTHIPPLFKLPLGLQRVQHAVLAGWEAPDQVRSRLLVLRGRETLRRLENEEEIVEVCASRGFEMVRPERMSITEQARAFARAEAIIGVKGAALTNAIFSRPDCALMVLSPSDFIDPFFWDIAGQKGLAYGEVFGTITSAVRLKSHNPFQVSPGQVAHMLDAILLARQGDCAPFAPQH